MNPILTVLDKQPAGNSPQSIAYMVFMIALLIAAFYFLMIRPNKKRQKEEEELRNSLQIGDEVITIGGIYGRVVSIKEESIVLESPADHSKLKMLKTAIQTNVTVTKANEEKKAAAAKERQKARAAKKNNK